MDLIRDLEQTLHNQRFQEERLNDLKKSELQKNIEIQLLKSRLAVAERELSHIQQERICTLPKLWDAQANTRRARTALTNRLNVSTIIVYMCIP